MTIKLKVDEMKKLQRRLGLNNTRMAARLGISRQQLWRAKAADNDPNHTDPSADFIARVLKLFPDKTFDDLFFLDESVRERTEQSAM